MTGDVVYGAETRGWEKYFRVFSKDLQIVVIFERIFLKKYFAGMEKGCTFAAVFVQNGTREKTSEPWQKLKREREKFEMMRRKR